jgi:hypothetical protein
MEKFQSLGNNRARLISTLVTSFTFHLQANEPVLTADKR